MRSTGIAPGDDTNAMIDCLERLGCGVGLRDRRRTACRRHRRHGWRASSPAGRPADQAGRHDVALHHRARLAGRRSVHDRRRSAAAATPDGTAARRARRARRHGRTGRGVGPPPGHRGRPAARRRCRDDARRRVEPVHHGADADRAVHPGWAAPVAVDPAGVGVVPRHHGIGHVVVRRRPTSTSPVDGSW